MDFRNLHITAVSWQLLCTLGFQNQRKSLGNGFENQGGKLMDYQVLCFESYTLGPPYQKTSPFSAALASPS